MWRTGQRVRVSTVTSATAFPSLSSPRSPAWDQLSLSEDTGRESLHLPVMGHRLVTSESLPASWV